MLLRQIQYFLAVIESGNFYDAAEQCHVSQSAISQQIKKLEEELEVQLLDRHNRTFTLTPAGSHFYRKSLILRSDVEQLIRETKRIAANDHPHFHLGCYKGYHGSELAKAIARFSETYPTVQVQVTIGSHEELYHAMEKGALDLALNDQRRAFSNAYHNVPLAESHMYVEISARNPLAHLSSIETSELKNRACILVTHPESQEEEQAYYESIIGLSGDFLFADSLQEARLMIITGQGYMPVDVIGVQEWFDTSVHRLPLTRNGEPVTKMYCAFWKKENASPYLATFAAMLEEEFGSK